MREVPGKCPAAGPIENVYTLEEVWDIMDKMKSDTARNRALIAFMLDSGCRRGEVMGLKWRDVDFVM